MKADMIDGFLRTTLQTLRIGVVGDLMVDRYVFGDVSRISPEAPVPVNRVRNVKDVPGGAANVAANLAHLGCATYVYGLSGNDEYADTLSGMLKEIGIDTTGIVRRDDRRTTTKMRILGGRQQMLRLDFEDAAGSDDVVSEDVFADCLSDESVRGLDGIVISDYGKGVCTPVCLSGLIAKARGAGIPIVVDPKGSDWRKYAGADYVTPNVKELGEAVGRPVDNTEEAVTNAAREILARIDIGTIAVTRSEKGITAVSRDGTVRTSPAAKQEVFDVSGAGDTVVAMLVTALAGGLEVRHALHAANVAAGVVVAKVGTYPIHREELLDIRRDMRRVKAHGGPIMTAAEAAEMIRARQAAGETVVFTNGCFDILHRGHVTYLKEAAALGDCLVVGLNSDASVKRLKGETRPLVAAEDRAALLAALGCVTTVVVFEEDTPAELLTVLRPDLLVKGGDYRPEDIIGREYVSEVKILPFHEGYSTTGIVEHIAALVREGRL